MELSEIPFTKDDFDKIDWQEVIEDIQTKVCHNYSGPLFAKAREAKEVDNLEKAAVLALLGAITSMRLQLDKPYNPFSPALVMATGRSAIIDDISESHWSAMQEIVQGIVDPEMQARMADILWVGKRQHQMARVAIDAYIKSARNLNDNASWVYPTQRIERALQLARMLNDQERYASVIALIETLLDQLDGSDSSFYSAKLMELLLENKKGDPQKYAPLAEKVALTSVQAQEWHRAIRYWTVAAQWRGLLKDSEGHRKNLLQVAEVYVQQADRAVAQSQPNYSVGWMHLCTAIEAFRRIEGTHIRIEELHTKVLEYQEKATSQMKPIGTELDVTDIAIEAIAAVKGKSFIEAFAILARLGSPPLVDELRQMVKNATQNFPLSHVIPTIALTERGKVSGRRPGFAESNNETFLQAEMFKWAQQQQVVHVIGIVEPARNQINQEHFVRASDILPLVKNNPFIPPGREPIFARGILAGLEGDFLVAGHLLVPQLENSLRHLLTMTGVISSWIDDEGIQDEKDLNTLIRENEGHLEAILGKDTVFDLRGLLVERFGSNLRNRLAHGLLSYDETSSVQMAYLWWITVRVCMVPVIHAQRLQNHQDDSQFTGKVDENQQEINLE